MTDLPEWLRPREGKEATMYLAHPTERHQNDPGLGERLEKFAWGKGFAPLNPFDCGKPEYFEFGLAKRPFTLEWTLYLQRFFGWSGYFGISAGVLGEFKNRLSWDPERHIRTFLYDDDGVPFDPRWQEKYEEFKPQFGDVMAERRGKNYLVIFVGPSAIGKTYLMEALKEFYGEKIGIVKNVTTRQRDNLDDRYYYVVPKQQFESAMTVGSKFLEYDNYFDNYYGSSFESAMRVLRNSHGMFALTPKGALEWHKCRYDFNILFIVLKPVNESVLLKNFERRKEKDIAKIAKALKRAAEFQLPSGIEHQVFEVTGTKIDKERMLDLVRPYLR